MIDLPVEKIGKLEKIPFTATKSLKMFITVSVKTEWNTLKLKIDNCEWGPYIILQL